MLADCQKERLLDHDEWMNDEVREEIEDLQRTHGFEEDEAVAFWHLQQAGKQINALWRADLREEMDRYEGRDDKEGQHATLLHGTAEWHYRVLQHFAALRRELGARVLRRDYPDGWGWIRVKDPTNEED
jgi:hypothetical protein